MRASHAVWALALLAGACSTAHVRPTLASDADLRMSNWRTYAWVPTPQQDEDAGGQAALQKAADRELASKGYRRVDLGPVDFVVRPHFSIEELTSVASVDPYTNEWVWDRYFGPSVGGSGAGEEEMQWEEGTVGVDALDPASGRVEWTASTKADLGEDPSDDEVQQKVDEAVTRVLSAFPSRQG